MEILKILQNRLRHQHRPRSVVIHLATHGRARIVAALSAPTLTTLRNVAVLSRSNAGFSWGGSNGENTNP